MKAILLFLLLLAPVLRAQEAARLSCRLLNFERDSGDIDTLHVVDPAGQSVECPLPRATLSKPVLLPLDARRHLTFRAEPSGKPVASAKVPSDIREALVIFLPSTNPKSAFKLVVLDGSDEGFPPSGSLVLNLYNQNVRLILGEHKIQLKPGGTVKLPRPEKRNNFNMAPVIFQFETPKGWRSAYETTSRFVEGQRHLYVSYVDPKSLRPRVRAYLD